MKCQGESGSGCHLSNSGLISAVGPGELRHGGSTVSGDCIFLTLSFTKTFA